MCTLCTPPLSQLEVRIAEPGEGLKTVGSSHGSQLLLPALLISGLLNLAAGSHLMSSFFQPDDKTVPERREDWTEQLTEPNYPYALPVESMQLEGDLKGELEVVEEQAEGEEQRFEDMYTPEVYYNLPRSLPMQYYAIA